MNGSEIEAEWEPMKALLVSRWHKLSEEEIALIDGTRDALAQVLQGVLQPRARSGEGSRGRDLRLREGRTPPGGGQISREERGTP